MREKQEELWQYYDAMGDADRIYILGMAKFLAARGPKVEPKLPSLTLVIGGRGGESINGQSQGLHDRFSAYSV